MMKFISIQQLSSMLSNFNAVRLNQLLRSDRSICVNYMGTLLEIDSLTLSRVKGTESRYYRLDINVSSRRATLEDFYDGGAASKAPEKVIFEEIRHFY